MKTIRKSGAWLHSRFYRRVLILGYHRIADGSDDPYDICVSPKNFSEQMAVLKRYAHPLRLSSLDEWFQNQSFSKTGVVITFDDAYADLLGAAKTAIEQHGFFAEVFVVTGCMGRQFWWDQLDQILHGPDRLPEKLDLVIQGMPFRWEDGNRKSPGQTRKELLLMLYRRLLTVSQEERERIFSDLETWAGAALKPNPPGPRALTAGELVELVAGGAFEAGSHSRSHPWFPALAGPDLLNEIQVSKHTLEKILGRPVDTFSYPNGSASQETADLIRQTGYRYACTSTNHVVGQHTDRYFLPRFWIPNISGQVFESWLKRWC